MKIPILLLTLGTIFIGQSNVSAELPVYPNSIWCKEPALRKAIDETYPGLVTRSYHFNTHTMVGILADEENKRVLFLLYPEGAGTLTIHHNGTQLIPKELSLALIKTKDKQGRIEYLDIGLWIPMSKTDTLKIEANITYSAKFDFSIKYDPDRDWRSSISEIKVDEAKLKKADAYHFSEDSLLEDVRSVLKKQPTCRVKLKHHQILTLKTWDNSNGKKHNPITYKFGKTIEMDGWLDINDIAEFKEELEGWIRHVSPEIRLQVTKEIKDDKFRQVLNAVRESGFRTAYIEFLNQPTPPKKSP